MLVGVVLPTPLLVSQRFHHDEALYSTWALQIVAGADPWLAQTPVDKPPLYLYTLAGAFYLLGISETAARIPSLLATALTVGLTFALGRSLYGQEVGALAAALLALSPFTLLFAPTAFTDPLLVMFIMAACLAAAHGQAIWAGVFLGLAIAVKQPGVFFAPLIIMLFIIYELRMTNYPLSFAPHVSHLAFHISCLLLATTLTLIPIIIWDLARPAPDFLTHSVANYGGLTSQMANFGERWAGFMELLCYATASPVLNGIFVVGLPILLLYGIMTAGPFDTLSGRKASRRPLTTPTPLPHSHLSPWKGDTALLPHSTQADWLFTLFILAFLLGHALFSFQVWDRYLLGLMPFLALLLARILLLPWSTLTQTNWAKTVNNISPPRRRERQEFYENFVDFASLWLKLNWRPLSKVIYGLALAVLLAVALTNPVRDAVNGRYPLGSNSRAWQGIEQIVAYLHGHAGANHTLYHRWLGPHWQFYLWGYPYDLQFWASPQELAARAKPGHLIAFPSWQSDTEARLALAQAGLELRELTRAYHPAGYPALILYEIVDGTE